jgi:hypothetical protein
MPNPTASDLHVNGLLGNLSVGYLNAATAFAAPQVFPYVDVQKQTDLYAVYDRGDFLRDGMQRRGPYDTAAEGGYRVSTASYAAEVWSLAKLVSDRERANADDPFRPDEDAAVWLTQQRLIRQERQWAADYFTTGVWTGSTTGTDLVGGTDFAAVTRWVNDNARNRKIDGMMIMTDGECYDPGPSHVKRGWIIEPGKKLMFDTTELVINMDLSKRAGEGPLR